MHSVFYITNENEIMRIGPFGTEAEALDAARNAVTTGEINAAENNVYLVDDRHNMVQLTMEDMTHSE